MRPKSNPDTDGGGGGRRRRPRRTAWCASILLVVTTLVALNTVGVILRSAPERETTDQTNRRQMMASHNSVPLNQRDATLSPDANFTAQFPKDTDDVSTKHPSTIVTAYFEFPSKHSSKEYDAWMANMLSLQDAMVIYTTADMVPKIERLRAHAIDHTVVVATTLEDTRVAKRYDAAFWKAQHQMDIERRTHKDVPTLRTDQVLMLDVTSLDKSFLRKTGGRKSVGGGFIGGYANGIELWYTKYYAMLDAHKQEFIGKEQPWMVKTCDANPGLCQLVVPDRKHGNPWFYMAPYMMPNMTAKMWPQGPVKTLPG
ncbi:glyco_trans_2-like domain-containing protein [Pycnococcus provasolii]